MIKEMLKKVENLMRTLKQRERKRNFLLAGCSSQAFYLQRAERQPHSRRTTFQPEN